MRQMENTFSIPVIILTLGFFSFVSYAQQNSMTPEDALLDSELDYDRRPEALGLGKRVYGYISEFKRLPLYNFGLGKRSHLYNFGLGKRSRVVDDNEEVEEYDEYPYNDEDDQMPELELYHDDNMQSLDKRQRSYSFGLGKRINRYDFGLGKRGQVYRYDFGLGKRNQPTVSRGKLYNFGLGKRNRLYSFGLGKRPYSQGPVPSRFNFGLGKRSEDFDISKNVIAKREVHEENPPEAAQEDNGHVATDSSQASTNKLEKLNNTAELESHEIMGHSERSQLSKRSPHRYDYGSGKKSVFSPNAGFSRQFRKPLYNFGLGKRTPSFKELPSKNDKSSQN